MSLTLSADQKHALDDLREWIRNKRSQSVRVGGYAGTGKTTLIGHIRRLIHDKNKKTNVAFACPTGMASQNLEGYLNTHNARFDKDYVGTIHRLIYTPVVDGKGGIIGWDKNDEIKADLLIVDEGSMVTREVWHDLLSFNLPIIVFGDHGQLPPVGDKHSLMEDPDIALEKIHRQAADNPIIKLATMARRGEDIPVDKYGNGIQKISRSTYESEEVSNSFFNSRDTDTLILCGTNKLRNQLNKHIRTLKGFESEEPAKGDKVVCLKNIYENKAGAIFNGMLGEIEDLQNFDKHRYSAEIYFSQSDTMYSGTISKEQFNSPEPINKLDGVRFEDIGDRFDFGYALTVHKAQGSQARKVLLFDESPLFREDKDKWLYTGITRAREELYILGN